MKEMIPNRIHMTNENSISFCITRAIVQKAFQKFKNYVDVNRHVDVASYFDCESTRIVDRFALGILSQIVLCPFFLFGFLFALWRLLEVPLASVGFFRLGFFLRLRCLVMPLHLLVIAS